MIAFGTLASGGLLTAADETQTPQVITASPVATPGPDDATAVAGTPEALAEITGVVQGFDATPQPNPVLVVPGEIPQPIDVEQFGTPDHLVTGTRAGVGVVMADSEGAFAVTGLAAGDYLVILIGPVTALRSPSGFTASVAFRGNALSNPAELVRLGPGAKAFVQFTEPPPPPPGPSSIRISVTVFDENGAAAVDSIASVTIEPSVEGAHVTLAEDGTALITNLPAGAFTVRVVTAGGSVITKSFTLQAGESGELHLVLTPPEPGGGLALPTTGSGPALPPRTDPAIVELVCGASMLICGLAVLRRTWGSRSR